ncbi:MAG: HAMP domain-containing sensor histidine kinase [Acidobacteriota bacterium]
MERLARSRPLPPWLGPAALVALLGVLGTLQVHWLEEIHDADRERTRNRLEDDVSRFADELNGELSRLVASLQPRHRGIDAADLLTTSWHRWQESARQPDLLDAVYLLSKEDTRSRAWILDAPAGMLNETTLPPHLASIGEELAAAFQQPGPPLDEPRPTGERSRRDRGRERVAWLRPLRPEIPALVVPFLGPSPAAHADESTSLDRDPGRARRPFDRRGRDGTLLQHRPVLLLVLDRDVLLDVWLPTLVRRHFGSPPSFHLRIVANEAAPFTASDNPPIFAAGPAVPGTAVVDATAPLFGPLQFAQPNRGDPRGRRLLSALAAMAGLDRSAWRLEARHPAGSLDTAVDRARTRNLLVVLGILAVLAASVIQLSRSARRTRELARRQIDFVAGVTHELRTPLAALRSAGQNLADGVVAAPNQVRRYGQLVDREAGRLSDLVDQVLAFARLQSSAPRLDLEAVEVDTVIAAVAEAHRSTLDAENIRLEVELDSDLPAVRADRRALERILGNLVANAAKYGQPAGPDAPRWIGLEARRAEPSRVEIMVRDRGPGIDPRDRPRLFEPFVRGRELAASAVPGSGLGLALVRQWTEAQDGRVDVAPTAGGGATFTVTLPMAETSSIAHSPTDGAS